MKKKRLPNSQDEREYLSAKQKEYLDAWDDLTPELRAEMKTAGVDGPDLGITPAPVRQLPEDECDPFAKIAAPEPQTHEEYDEDLEKDERVQALARQIGGELLFECLTALTRSNITGLRRAADTMVLSFSTRASDAASQAALARKYGISRAAVSKDIAHIAQHKSFGLITGKIFSDKVARKEDSDRAKKVHADNALLADNPPLNSFADFLK